MRFKGDHAKYGARGGVALSAMALVVLSGIEAVAQVEDPTVDTTVGAIEVLEGGLVGEPIDLTVTDEPVTVSEVEVTVPTEAEAGVEIGGEYGDIVVGLPFAETADSAVVADGMVVYDNNNGSSTTPLVQEDGSVQIVTTIENAAAPTEYAYGVTIPTDGEAILRPDGGVDVVDGDGVIVVALDAPWATDARGVNVTTWFDVTEAGIVQYVDHLEAGYTYPVVADPSVSYGVGIYYHFNKAETKTIGKDWVAISAGSAAACAAAGSAIGSLAPGVGTAIGGVIGGAACLTVVGPIAYRAAVGMNSSPMRCLYVRVIPGLGIAGIWNGTYLDSRCR